MSRDDLTPDALKQQSSDVVAKGNTFKPQGVSEQDAKAYLNTDEGAMYWWRVAEADPRLSSTAVDERAIGQLKSGLELPRMVTIGTNEALVKFVAEGSSPSAHSPFWAIESKASAAVAAGKNISDVYGLPIGSEKPRYGEWRMTAKVPTQVFINTVAPTSELNGLVTKPGGEEQYLVPNRQLFNDPVHVRSVNNTLILAAEVERGGLSPNLIRGAAAVTAVYEATTTTVHSVDLLRQGNVTGAKAQIEHFASRTVGGFGLGAVGAEIGSLGGPVGTMAGGAVGYGFGAFGGQKLMDAYDNHKVYNQADAQDRTWSYDPKQPQQGWTRDIPPLPDTPHGQHFRADPALAERLTFQANNTAVELALARPAEPRDPYAQPAAAHDTPSRVAAPWTRDAQTQQWSRLVTDRVLEHGLASTHVEQASATRATQLDTAAQQTITENLAGSKRGIAEHYQAMYEQHGMAQYGAMPEAVANALHPPIPCRPRTVTPTSAARMANGTRPARCTAQMPPKATCATNWTPPATSNALCTAKVVTPSGTRKRNASRKPKAIPPHAKRLCRLHLRRSRPGCACRSADLRMPRVLRRTVRTPRRLHRLARNQQRPPLNPATPRLARSRRSRCSSRRCTRSEQAQQARSQEERPTSPSRAATTLEPGRFAEAAALAPSTVPSQHATAPTLSPPLDPPSMRDFRHAEHPLNARYEMFRDALGEQGFHQDRPTLNEVPEVRGYSAEQKDRLAAGFTAQLGTDTRYHTEIRHFGKEGDALLAVEHPRRLGDTPLVLSIDHTQTLSRTPEEHAATWRARELPAPQSVNTARSDPQTLSPDHPGHPDHPHHAMFEHARAALTSEYARWGLQKGSDPLDRETMQVMIAARDRKMDDVGAIRLWKGSPDGRIGEHPMLSVYDTAHGPQQSLSNPGVNVGFVESQTLQHAPPMQQAAPQFQTVDQQATQQIQQAQQWQAQINAQGQQASAMGGPGMGR